MNDCLAEYYRCPKRYTRFGVNGKPSEESGYFHFGKDVVCYGKLSGEPPSARPSGNLCDAMDHTVIQNGFTYLPFDATEVADNLRFELYARTSCSGNSVIDPMLRKTYYFARPLMPVAARRYLQKAWLADWSQLQFPRWPVDRTVDRLFEQLLLLSLRSRGVERIPFIWFWPNGAPSCAVMTHDVETTRGRDFCTTVMDLDEANGIQSSFGVVPEHRYEVTTEYLDSIWKRGFEVIVQDLKHDGHLFRNRKEFLARVKKINAYGKQFGATGFRAAVLFREQMWFDALKFSYDMSVPNVGHLEAQRGGCCTVMPYFVGDILELPVTTTQDYALFNYLNMYSVDLWKRQIELIMEKYGLINLIVHPDYIMESREWNVYKSLLAHLAQLRHKKGLWIPRPGDVDRWWRQRAKMMLVEDRDGVRIEGEGSERACIAYASENDGRLVFTLET